MACCGGRRAQFRGVVPPRAAVAAPARAATRANAFEYVGRTALTVIGPVSHKTYRFDHPGARVEIDARDVSSMQSIPVLRRA